MSHEVRLRPLAIEDLVALHRWISAEAGVETADGYLDRIADRLSALAEFPARGTPRDDLSPGIRTLAFERRLVIAYRIDGPTVTVLRVVNAARDLGRQFDA